MTETVAVEWTRRSVRPYSSLVPGWQIPPAQNVDYRVRIHTLRNDATAPVEDQHVVSRVLLKGFAAPGSNGQGWHLTPYNVRRRMELKSRGLRGCGKRKNFVQFASGSAELMWKSVEDHLGQAVAAARTGNLHNDRTHVDILKKAIALHLVRSRRYMAIHDASVTESAEEVRRDTLRTRTDLLRKEFRQRYGLIPAGSESLEIIVNRPIDEWLDLNAQGALARVSMENLFERIARSFDPLGLEVWHVEPPDELLISDSPAYTIRYSNSNTVVTPNVALGDSHGTMLPIATDCIIAIGPNDKDDHLPPETAELHNRLQVITADEYVYYRPTRDLRAFVESVLESHDSQRPPA